MGAEHGSEYASIPRSRRETPNFVAFTGHYGSKPFFEKLAEHLEET